MESIDVILAHVANTLPTDLNERRILLAACLDLSPACSPKARQIRRALASLDAHILQIREMNPEIPGLAAERGSSRLGDQPLRRGTPRLSDRPLAR